MSKHLPIDRDRVLGSCLRCVLILFAWLHVSSALAQAPTPTPDEAAVTVLNRTVTVFRAPFLGVTPADRAHRAERTISMLLDRGGAGKVTVQREPQGSVLLIDGSFALILVPQDVDVISGESLETATQSAVAALSRAIAETQEGRDRGRLLLAAGRTGLATALFALAVWLIRRVRHALFDRAAVLLEAAAAGAQVAGGPLLHSQRLRAFAQWLVRIVSWLLLAILGYEWLAFVLTQFAYTRAWGEQLDGFLLGIAQRIGGGVLRSLPDLVIAAVIFLLARSFVAAVRPVFDRIEQDRDQPGWLDRDMVKPTRRIVSVAAWLFAIVMAYPYLPGAGSEAFKGMSVLVGLMITLGGSSLIGQAASGLILMYSRTLRVGEYVRIDSHEGTVTELGTFTTRMRTGLGEEITLPNALVMGTTTKNYSRAVQGRGFVLDTMVTIGYDTPWRQVEAMLVEAASRTPGVLASPRPRVFQTALSDFYVEYRLVCQAVPEEPRPRAEVLHMLHANVLDVFNEQGVQIMSPHYLGDPPAPKVVPADDRYAAPPRDPAHKLVE